MAVTLSRYLRLRIDSNLTANARYNLERIDLLAATFQVDTLSNLNIRSESDIVIEPQSADVGGDGAGGSVTVGTSSHSLTSFNVYASDVTFSSSPGLLDQGTSGTKYLRLKYDSTLSGSVDTTADRTLSVDLNGADRSLILGGSFSLLGGGLSLTLPASQAYTYPSGYGAAGQIWVGDGSGGWSWADASGGGDVSQYSTTWLNADGTTKAVTHGLNSSNPDISVYDEANELILVDVADITTANSITLTSSEAPVTSWKIVVQA